MSARRIIAVIIVAAVALAVAWLIFRNGPPPPPGQSGAPGSAQKPVTVSVSTPPVSAADIPPVPTVDPSTVTAGEVRERIAEAFEKFKDNPSPDEARKILANLKAFLAALPRDVASAAMVAFLDDTPEDIATGLGFSVGEGGFLDDPPSMRVALLDWLGRFDLYAAGQYAEKIFATSDDPDAWAISFRNYARAFPTSDRRPFLVAQAEKMLANEAWRAAPSVGFLESFDVFVHTRSTASTPLLSQVVADLSPEGRATAHAAFLTLDRLTLAEPVDMMTRFLEEPELFEARGPMVANFYARADLRDAQQRTLVETYLLDPARSIEELTAFAGVYPNANMMISNNLLTNIQTPERAEIVEHDRGALDVVEQWSADPRFDPVRPHVNTMRNRLTTFVRQAEAGN